MAQEIATDLELQLVGLINQERASNNLPPVHTEVHLNASAQSHSNWMAGSGTFSHSGDEGSSPKERMVEADFPLQGSWRTAENIAYVSLTGAADRGEAEMLHANLMNSPPHRANILKPDILYVGIGLSLGNLEQGGHVYDVLYLTQNFGNTEAEVIVQQNLADGTTETVPFRGGVPIGDGSEVTDLPDQKPPFIAPFDDDDDDYDDDDDDGHHNPDGSGGGCFVATAAYGDRSHPDVIALRRFRDEVLVRHKAGRAFVRVYWVIGPVMAKRISHDGVVGRALRRGLSSLVKRLPR